MVARLWSVVFDANDPVALARFWAAALDWEYAEEDGISDNQLAGKTQIQT